MDTVGVVQIENEIRERLSRITSVEAVLLMGSCARNEETYFINYEGKRELLSDFEMLVVLTDLRDKQYVEPVLQQIREKFKSISTSVCFDVEWLYKTKSELSHLDKRFIFFEAKKSAKLILGNPDVIHSFPEITLRNMNFCELNGVIIHRLYHVAKDQNEKDEHYLKYLIARNTLDIPTAILPLMGYLQASYQKRNEIVMNLARAGNFDKEFANRLYLYMDMKLDYSSPLYDVFSVEDMMKQFIADIEWLYSEQKHRQNGFAFRMNIRMMLSGIVRLRYRRVYIGLTWNSRMEKLYHELMECVKCNTYHLHESDLKEKMLQYFDYN